MIGISFLGLVVAFTFLIYFAYKGYSVIVLSPIAAIIAIIFGAVAEHSHYSYFLAEYTFTYMQATGVFFMKYFPLFLLGAILGKIIDVTGIAKSIAYYITKVMGKKAISSVVISCAVLTYGGVSLFVVVFAVYPIAVEMFKKHDIPKRLIPASIALGSFTFSMTALPGTPAIQNVIPTEYFHTDVFAAPILGIVASIIMLALGLLWLDYRSKVAKKNNEGYGDHPSDISKESNDNNQDIISPFFAFLPILLILLLNYFFSKYVYVSNGNFSYLSIYNSSIDVVGGNWAVITSLIIVIIISILMYWNKLKDHFSSIINEGANGSVLAILNTSVVVGFGAVIKSTMAFNMLKMSLVNLKGTPLLSFAISVTSLAGVTGSSSGGLSIAMSVLAEQYILLAEKLNIPLEVLHRVATVASGGLDSLPHCGAVITLLMVSNLTHKESYTDIGMVSVIFPIFAVIAIIVLGSMGVV